MNIFLYRVVTKCIQHKMLHTIAINLDFVDDANIQSAIFDTLHATLTA